MADTMKRQCIDELLARYAAYTWPAFGDGQGALQTVTAEDNPRNIEIGNYPAVLLRFNSQDATKTYENVAQWMEVQPMLATVRFARFAGCEDVAELLETYLHMATTLNTSGAVDVDLGGLGYIEIKATRTRFGDGTEPFIEADVSFDLTVLFAIADPTAIV